MARYQLICLTSGRSILAYAIEWNSTNTIAIITTRCGMQEAISATAFDGAKIFNVPWLSKLPVYALGQKVYAKIGANVLIHGRDSTLMPDKYEVTSAYYGVVVGYEYAQISNDKYELRYVMREDRGHDEKALMPILFTAIPEDLKSN